MWLLRCRCRGRVRTVTVIVWRCLTVLDRSPFVQPGPLIRYNPRRCASLALQPHDFVLEGVCNPGSSLRVPGRAPQRPKPGLLKPSLVATHGARIPLECAGDVVLVRPSLAHQQNLGIRATALVVYGKVEDRDARNRDNGEAISGMQPATRVDNDDPFGRGVVLDKESCLTVLLQPRDVTEFPTNTPEKSGHVFGRCKAGLKAVETPCFCGNPRVSASAMSGDLDRGNAGLQSRHAPAVGAFGDGARGDSKGAGDRRRARGGHHVFREVP